MKKRLIITGDGSHSFFVTELQEVYHSKHGAINEARHVFIKNGICYILHIYLLQLILLALIFFSSILDLKCVVFY